MAQSVEGEVLVVIGEAHPIPSSMRCGVQQFVISLPWSCGYDVREVLSGQIGTDGQMPISDKPFAILGYLNLISPRHSRDV
jgi:hypothetical protein